MAQRQPPKFPVIKSRSLIVLGLIATWLPAFGFLTDDSVTWVVVEAGLALAVLLAAINEIWGFAPIKRKRAILDMLLMSSGFLITFIVYATRITEYLIVEMPFPPSVWIGQLIGLASIVFAIKRFRSTVEELNGLYRLGLLRRYQILDETEGTWTHISLPGLDGSTPEQRIQHNYQKTRWLLMIPAGGIAFYIIRTWHGSAVWVLFLINLSIYCLFLYVVATLCAYVFQLIAWEGQFGKRLYIKEKK
jgi:hypothetical protein